MTPNAWIQCSVFLILLLSFIKPLGAYMAWVYEGRVPVLERWAGPLERLLYRLGGISPEEEMSWQNYALAMMLFNGLGIGALYFLQRIQHLLPLNPMHLGSVPADTAFNTAVSFGTNTDWQSYSGESTMSYWTQMTGLTVQNFLSAATGMAVMAALIRGFVRRQSATVGNFWADMIRSVFYILIPLSLILSVALVSQGVVQTFRPSVRARTLQTGKTSSDSLPGQWIALGPVASQEAIKMVGTNGGGYFNANSAHPFENPTPISNLLEVLAILLIPASLCFTFGKMVSDTRQGWALLAAMTIIFIPLLWLCVSMEQRGNPSLLRMGVDQKASALQSGGNMEGKETRFGIVNSAIWASATTAASNGSVNAMHDSFTPLGGMVPMVFIQLSEVIYGGAGCGLYGMILYVIVAVFLAGLMVGRTPEYLGKKIEAYEMKMASIGILISPSLVLVGTAVAVVAASGKAGVANPGPHGFSEILYSLSSAGNNNGSAFSGLSANTPFYNSLLGIVMFLARYWIAIPVLAMAGSLASKKNVPESPGTLPTHTPLFILFLVGVVVFVGALTYIPALALGPIVEHLMLAGAL